MAGVLLYTNPNVLYSIKRIWWRENLIRKSKFALISFLFILFVILSDSFAQETIRVRGGIWIDWADSKGRIWHSGHKADQEWGGYVGKVRPGIVVSNPANGDVLKAESKKLVAESGYDLEIFSRGGNSADPEGIKYSLKTGNGRFDFNYLSAEHWDPGRCCDLVVENKIVKHFPGPKEAEAVILTFERIKVTDGTMEIHIKRSEKCKMRSPIFMGIEVYPSGKNPRSVDAQKKLAAAWGRIKYNH